YDAFAMDDDLEYVDGDGGDYDEDDDDEFLLKGVTYPQEMIDEWDNNSALDDQQQQDENEISSPEDELCVIDSQFDIDPTQKPHQKLPFKPKKHKHLFRYSPDISVACWLATVSSRDMLRSCGYTAEELERMEGEFPKLLSDKMDAKNLVAPKLRFLVSVLGGGWGDIGTGLTDLEEMAMAEKTMRLSPLIDGEEAMETEEEEFVPHNLYVSHYARNNVPTTSFFQPRLETTMAPRHAYLALHKDTLPHGRKLLESKTLLTEFLGACTKKPAVFASLCQRWEREKAVERTIRGSTGGNGANAKEHTAETVAAMDDAFSDGLTPFARNERTPELDVLGCTPSEMMALLLDHGANYAEHDDWGSTVLHWAAGTGNLRGMQALIEKLEMDEIAAEGDTRDVLWSTCASCSITRDGATPLHWAACGANHTHFGCGGHVDVCRYLLDKAGDKKEDLANSVTATGNTPLMWATWSGSLDVAKVLVKEGSADPNARNDNGFTAAHWAASGGNLEVCQYLHEELGLQFFGKGSENGEGETPLSCALSYGRSDIAEWIAKQTP
ncbi:hypothetical protein ACHAXS_006443, partial [Conticribra weissflogii]